MKHGRHDTRDKDKLKKRQLTPTARDPKATNQNRKGDGAKGKGGGKGSGGGKGPNKQ